MRSLSLYIFLDKTSYFLAVKHLACASVVVGILTQSGGFLVHLIVGRPNEASIGNTISAIGTVLLVCAILLLLYGLMTAP